MAIVIVVVGRYAAASVAAFVVVACCGTNMRHKNISICLTTLSFFLI